jgi:gamma-glutamyltranspeptidase
LNGLVVTDHKLASLAGSGILKKGGNAADSAVAASAALTVIDPYMSGLGGFGYLLYYDASSDKVEGIDYIGTAPMRASIDLFSKEKPWEDYKPTAEGILAMLVPGIVAGWMKLLDLQGTMKLKDVLAPAIELAGGYQIPSKLYRFYESIKSIAGTIRDNASIFYAGGHYPRPGQRLSQPALRKTLKTLAEKGAEDFYEGTIAKRIVSLVKERGGLLELEDLARYKANPTGAVSSSFGGYEVYSHRPGSSGITVLQWLNILEKMDLDRKRGFLDEENMHYFLEAGKLALRDDDIWNSGKDYAKIPMANLTSKEYALRQASKIGGRASFYKLVTHSRNYGGLTKHHCTCDQEGNIVSATETQMYGFDRIGVFRELGFNLNGGMCYFSLDPKNIERLEPGKRPRYVMSPTFAFKDDRIITAGAAGGWTIPQTVTQTLYKIMHFDLGIQEAVSTPRFVLRYRYNSIPYAPGTVVDLENGIPKKRTRQLEKRGHLVSTPTTIRDFRPGWGYGFGAVNALSRSGSSMEGGAETRRGGYVAKVG